jgi:DNA-3-methyladenine glycosylase I
MSYCQFVTGEKEGSLHRKYHDTAYGFPIHNDDELFGRLILEINQAGLSWNTILKKEKNFRVAYDNFSITKISNYGDREVTRLLSDPGIIRNRLKVAAAIHNAQVITGIQRESGSFKNWLDSHHPKTRDEWTKLFKKTFKFTGGEIVNEFFMSTGYLEGAHDVSCPVYKKVLRAQPAWNCKK